jgi:hypothetical protein
LHKKAELAEITLQQFGGELDYAEKAGILELKENILVKEAERLWEVGQFWDKKRYYGSAKSHYEKLLIKYPQTEFAEKARKRMAQIENEPDIPSIFSFPINPFKAEK